MSYEIGTKYAEYKGIKELAEQVREYVKKYTDYKFSVRVDNAGWTPKLFVMLTSGKCLTKDENLMCNVKGNLNTYSLARKDNTDKRLECFTQESLDMLVDVNEFIQQYHYVDSDIMTDYYNTNFYYDLEIDWYYTITDKELNLITPQSMCKSYAELYRKINGKRVQVEYVNEDKYHQNYIGRVIVKSNTYEIERESDKKHIWCEKQNKITRILANGFEKLDTNMQPFVKYTILEEV